MGNMLEQAIVDAAALKEAAVEEAKRMINENFSKQINEAVNKILESDAPKGLNEADEEEDVSLNDINGSSDGALDAPKNPETTKPNSMVDSTPAAYDTPDEEDGEMIELDLRQLEEMILKELQDSSNEEIEGDLTDRQDIVNEITSGSGGSVVGSPDTDEVEEEPLFEAELEKAKCDFDKKLSAKDKELKESKSLKNKLDTENKSLNEGITKRDKVISELTKKLNEQNLRTAKLFYANKVLMDLSLNEKQKGSLVESISKAESIDKAKMIFELRTTGHSNHRVAKPESLNEAIGFGRSTTQLIKDRSESEFKLDPAFERMAFLAGTLKKAQ